jgi:SagB-type dehydrogenase family enzyme
MKNQKRKRNKMLIELPQPDTKGILQLETLLQKRRSRREFANAPISIENLAQLLWSGQGVSGGNDRLRTAPSAGACHPLTLYAAVGENTVSGLGAGVYQYLPEKHALQTTAASDLRSEIAEKAFQQKFLGRAPIVLIFTVRWTRSTGRYGERGHRYALLDLGHAAENIHLQAEALQLSSVMIGAFEDAAINNLLGFNEEEVLYLIPIGHRK